MLSKEKRLTVYDAQPFHGTCAARIARKDHAPRKLLWVAGVDINRDQISVFYYRAHRIASDSDQDSLIRVWNQIPRKEKSILHGPFVNYAGRASRGSIGQQL